MKKLHYVFLFLLAFVAFGCPKPIVVKPRLSDVFKNGNMTTALTPPGLIGTPPKSTQLIAFLIPAPNQGTVPPNYVCDPVDFTVSFPSVSGTQQYLLILSTQGNPPNAPTLIAAFSDRPAPGYQYLPSPGSAKITVNNTNGIMNGLADTIYVWSGITDRLSNLPSFGTQLNYPNTTSTPIPYPGPNCTGNDISTYSGANGTPPQAQIQVTDESYN